MEPGEYLTNVLSSNNYATIQYEYFEYPSPFSGASRKQLQRLESTWRQNGSLVHCDSFREGIWRFRGTNNSASEAQSGDSVAVESSAVIEAQGMGLLLKEKGAYEPASLGRSKLVPGHSFSALSTGSSPSSSVESTIRNSQAFNARAVQANASQSAANEPPTPSPGIKSATGSAEIWPVTKDIHESFISAALGSIVYFLCHDHGFIPLNSRTLILTTSSSRPFEYSASNLMHDAEAITLATLDISLTSLGTIVVKAHSDTAPGLQSLSQISQSLDDIPKLTSGTALWLAPGGNAAKFYGNRDDKNLPGSLLISHLQIHSSENRQNGFNGVTIQSWQSKCLEWLSAKGLNATVLEDGGWIFVQVLNSTSPYFNADYPGNPMLEDLTIVPWPALLCFQTAGIATRDVQTLTLNPLLFAEEWFVSRDERAALILKRRKERQISEAKSKEQADVDARNIQSTTFSPAALRRGSNAGAMYPTPPDAIHHPVGATPNFEATASTPGNPNALFSHDVEAPPQHMNPSTSNLDGDIWGSGKKDPTTTNLNFNDNDNVNDSLFGEVELFNAITDEDFDFFDEPDAIPMDPPPIPSHDEAPPEPTIPADVIAIDSPVKPPAGDSDTNMLDLLEAQLTDEGNEEDAKPKDGVSDKELQITTAPHDATKEIAKPMISPPFDMESVFKRVVQESPIEIRKSAPRRSSVFNKVDFEKTFLSVNEKYGSHGRFSFSENLKSVPVSGSRTLPTTKYLGQRQKLGNSKLDSSSLIRLLQNDSQVVEVTQTEDQDMFDLVDSDLGSPMSEQDDTSHGTADLSMSLNPGVKRKWTLENDGGEDMASSFNGLAVEYAQSAGTPLSLSGSQFPLLEGDPADWSLTTYFTSPEPDIHSNVLPDLECIATAQILADQAVSGTIKLPGAAGGYNSSDANASFRKISTTRELMHFLGRATKSCFKDIAQCTLRSYLDIQGIPILNQAHRLPPRPIPNPRGAHILDAARTNNPFAIPPPQLEVRRSESKLSVLPSAVSFWENLGLGPSQGNKDVAAMCVYPSLDGVASSAGIFLNQMGNTYESFRLGSHEGLVSKETTNSLVPYTIDTSQPIARSQLASLKETTARVSRILSSVPVEDKNFVVYFVYPLDNPALLVHICSSFQHLFNLYRKSLSDRKITATNELVLQLIPLDFIASPISIVVPWPSEYARLAMEVYDRCIDFTSYSSTSAILLEQPLPKQIEFKLTANPSASLLQENSCLHIAYAQSIDDRWITAAWTDNRGTKQMTASYCLGRKNEPLSLPFSDIANEIWETTLDIVTRKKIHWRIMISRVGVMDPSEQEFWTGLASTESDAQISLTLITVQTDPSLRLLPPSITLAPNTSSTQAAITPVSTPQAPSIVSPDTASTPVRDTATNVATPVDPIEPDSDARLIDYTDQSWGCVLSHRLNNSNSLLDLNPALISGYLLKRGGTNSDDPLVAMEVNIIHADVVGNPRTFHEGLLREVLGYYRGLGTLARVRGVVDGVRDVRPWHIAAAEKAVKALYMLM